MQLKQLGLIHLCFIAFLTLTSCEKIEKKDTLSQEKLANAYPVKIQKPDGTGTLAKYRDQTFSLETILKASRQAQEFLRRQKEFEMLIAYKKIASTDLSDDMDDGALTVTFFQEKPQSDFSSLLKLIDFQPDVRIQLNFQPSSSEKGLIAQTDEKKYFLKDLDLNHKIWLDLNSKIYDEKMKQLAQVITYQEIKKAADAQGLTATQFLQQNNLATAEKATDKDVQDYMASINAQPDQIDEITFEKFRSILTQRKQDHKVKVFVATQLIKEPIILFIEKPNSALDMADSGTNFQGKKESSVTMVLFSDLMCSDCQNLWSHIEKVRETYGDGIRLGFRNYFLSNDNFARFVAEASQCVQQQSPTSFWTFIDRIQNEQEAVNETIINESAQFSGVNMDKFHECLKNRESREIVEKDLEYAHSLGLQKVPTLIVSGKTFYGKARLNEIMDVVKNNYVKEEKGFFSKIFAKLKALIGINS